MSKTQRKNRRETFFDQLTSDNGNVSNSISNYSGHPTSTIISYSNYFRTIFKILIFCCPNKYDTSLKVNTRHLCVDERDAHHELHNAYGDMVPFRVLCAVRTQPLRHRSRWWLHCMVLFVQLSALRGSSHCKHDMGALSCSKAEQSKECPPPLLADL